MTKALTKEEMERLGSYFDEHGEEEWEEAERNGNVFSVSELGCDNAASATAKLAEMQEKGIKPIRKMYSFRLPVFVVDGLKEKAKAQHKPYQRFVNEVLAQAAVK